MLRLYDHLFRLFISQFQQISPNTGEKRLRLVKPQSLSGSRNIDAEHNWSNATIIVILSTVVYTETRQLRETLAHAM